MSSLPLLSAIAALDVELLCVQTMFQVMLLSYGCWLFYPHPRNPSFFEQRLCWETHAAKHTNRGTFAVRLRMQQDSYDKLLSCVRAELLVNETMAKPRGGAITPEICLFCTLRWLAGGSYLDIIDIVGISKSSFYRILWKTMRAIVRCPELEIRFPSTAEEVQKAMADFATISFQAAVTNCVGVVDGYLLRIRVPTKKEVGNVRSHFSGHYQCYGMNIQAVADHWSRFVYFALAAPGVAQDRDAIKQCNLNDMIEALPFGSCVIGDNAHEATERLVPIFGGLDRLNADADNFNFCASQLRIRIEMAFGLMQMKWGILQRPLQAKLSNVRWQVQAIARLHNFVINERLLRKEGLQEGHNEGGGLQYLPTVPHDDAGEPIELNPLLANCVRGYSELREQMLLRVKNLQLKRPAANKIVRNSNSA